MGRSRVELNNKLLSILGSNNVYYNPPESVKISYPCIIYTPERPSGVHANNRRYFNMVSYNVLLISRDPEWGLPQQIAETFEFCDPGAPYTTDNLWHWPLTIYF